MLKKIFKKLGKILNLIRSAFLNLTILISSLLCAIIFSPFYLINKDFASYSWRRHGSFVIINLMRLFGMKLEIDQINIDEPTLIVSNHCTILDGFICQFSMGPHPLVFFMKKSIQIVPYFYDCIFLSRDGSDMSFVKGFKRTIDENKSVFIFPQGTRVMPGQYKEYSKSIAMLARRFKVPVAICALNTGQMMKKKFGILMIDFSKTIKFKLLERTTYDKFLESQNLPEGSSNMEKDLLFTKYLEGKGMYSV